MKAKAEQELHLIIFLKYKRIAEKEGI